MNTLHSPLNSAVPEPNPMLAQLTPFIVMEVLEKAKAMESAGEHVIHLEVGEPDFDVPECVSKACLLSQQNGETHYTHSLGNQELRTSIARFYQKEYGVKVSEEQILVTSGSSPAILMAMMALLDAGDEILLTNPGYPCYRNFALACRAVPKFVEVFAKDGFQINPEAVKALCTPRTKALVVNSPMNPTGTLVKDEVFAALAELNIPILSDEIYHGLVYAGRARTALEFTRNAFVINGFSKRFAMTGLRLGYLIAPEAYIRPLQILQQNLFICAPSTAQAGAVAALEQASDAVEQMRKTYNERRIYLIQRLRDMGLRIETEPTGAFYVLADAKAFTRNSLAFAFDVLEKAKVGITPGIDFGSNAEGYIRLSYANSMENLKMGMDRLQHYLQTHGHTSF